MPLPRLNPTTQQNSLALSGAWVPPLSFPRLMHTSWATRLLPPAPSCPSWRLPPRVHFAIVGVAHKLRSAVSPCPSCLSYRDGVPPLFAPIRFFPPLFTLHRAIPLFSSIVRCLQGFVHTLFPKV